MEPNSDNNNTLTNNQLKELFENNCEKVYKAAYMILHNADMAKDAAQEAILKAWNNIGTLNDVSKFEAWIHMIVTNTCRNMIKKTQYQNKKIALYDKYENIKYNICETNAHYIPEKQFEKSELKKELSRHMSQLSSEEQYILFLRFHCELSYERIAACMQLKAGTVKSKVCRAKMKIYDRMQGYYYTDGTEKIKKRN